MEWTGPGIGEEGLFTGSKVSVEPLFFYLVFVGLWGTGS
jgi:hypothetical protein